MVAPFFEPWRTVRSAAAVPWYVETLWKYRRMSDERIPLLDLYPSLRDRGRAAGAFDVHYFYQDIWAAKKVHASGCTDHVDVASRVDGFVAHCACFTRVTFIDLRPLVTDVPEIQYRQGTVLALPFADISVASLSCLHVVEHVGLGRYGDPLDSHGSIKAMAELQRVLAPGGSLYFGIPVGRERVAFNAHRIFSPRTIAASFGELDLVSFSVIDDGGRFHELASLESYDDADYACGLFHFSRSAR
jgi:SAM-dependent methyltransferase